MNSYRYCGNIGLDTVDSGSDLMALRIARIMGGRPDMKIISRWNGERWVSRHVTQMLYSDETKHNLKHTYGSCSKQAFAKAQREFERE